MTSIWTIAGEAGKTMDATARQPEALGVVNGSAVLTFRNLATDTLIWNTQLDGLATTTEILPQLGQVVTLYRSGVRFFKGHVTGLKQTGRLVTVTVSGPWWWLERVFLESVQTDETGAAGDRPTYVLPAQSLTTSLQTILQHAIDMGVPFSIGALATTFSAPQMKLDQMSFAMAVGEVIRVTPDMVLYFDYSGSTPAAKTVRRKTGLAVGSASPLTLDARGFCEDGFELNPVPELQVTRVRATYITRAGGGSRQFASQNSGSASLGNDLLLAVSGGEMDTFLPLDSAGVLEAILAASSNRRSSARRSSSLQCR